MKRKVMLPILVLLLMLSGCSWMDGSYVSVTPHQQQVSGVQSGSLSASNYQQLCQVLAKLVENGTESAVIHVADYDQNRVEEGMAEAALYMRQELPLGAYAVEDVSYEIGTGGGQPAISVNITYIHGRSEIRNIHRVDNMYYASRIIGEALDQCNEGVVLLVDNYSGTDIAQLVEDYASEHPDVIMETPQVAVGLYPDQGVSRVMELKFTYQTSRDSLRQMQNKVQRVFASAALYVSSDGADSEKTSQLYTFLTERFDYDIETSITPSYSLLMHGVGDSEAFAGVFAAMCRQAGLDCRVVSGTRAGEAWFWNLIREDGVYYHVDLLQSKDAGGLQRMTDEQMQGYVWDYSAYPASAAPAQEPEN